MSHQTGSSTTVNVESQVPLPHHPMSGPSNARADEIDAERRAQGLIDARSPGQIARDIAARQERIATTAAVLRDRVSPKQVIKRKKQRLAAAVDRLSGGRSVEVAGAAAGAVVVLVVLYAVAKNKRGSD